MITALLDLVMVVVFYKITRETGRDRPFLFNLPLLTLLWAVVGMVIPFGILIHFGVLPLVLLPTFEMLQHPLILAGGIIGAITGVGLSFVIKKERASINSGLPEGEKLPDFTCLQAAVLWGTILIGTLISAKILESNMVLGLLTFLGVLLLAALASTLSTLSWKDIRSLWRQWSKETNV